MTERKGTPRPSRRATAAQPDSTKTPPRSSLTRCQIPRATVVERAAIRIWDLSGGIILTLLAFFASLFALVWASTNIWSEAGAGTSLIVALGFIAVGGLMLTPALLAAVRSTGK